MKLKEQGVERDGMSKELYDLFIEILRLEYNKAQFLKGAQFYCWAHGFEDYSRFFASMSNQCNSCRNDFIDYLLGKFEKIPEIQIDGIKVEYKDVEEVFSTFVEFEESFVELLERIVTKAKELNDVYAMAFTMPILNKIDHIACRALEAVRNDQNPYDLLAFGRYK